MEGSLLSLEELTQLMGLLRQDDKSLDSLMNLYTKSLPKGKHFRGGCVLYILLQDKLLEATERITAFYILYDLYSTSPLASNPFLPIFIDTLQEAKSDKSPEHLFLVQLLTGSPPKELLRKSPRELLERTKINHHHLHFIGLVFHL